MVFLLGGDGCDDDALGIDHFSHNAAGAIGCDDEDGIEVESFGGDALEVSEEGVGGGVGTGEGHAEPTEEGCEEGVEPTGVGEGEAEGGIASAEFGDEGEGDHAGDGEEGVADLEQGLTEEDEPGGPGDAEPEAGDETSEEDGGAGGGEPVAFVDGGEGLFGAVGAWWDVGDGGSDVDGVMEEGDGEIEFGSAMEEIGMSCRAAVEFGFDGWPTPEEDEEGEEDPRSPCVSDLGGGEGWWGGWGSGIGSYGMRSSWSGMGYRGWSGRWIGELGAGGRLPEAEERGEGDEGAETGGDIDQRGAV